MTIAILFINLFVPQANSLKAKRQLIKSIKDRIRRKFNVSIAEIADTDKWQRASLALACVNSNKRFVDSVLSKVVNLVDAQAGVELIDYKIEFY